MEHKTANPFGHLAEAQKSDDTPIDVVIEDRDGNPYIGKAGNPIVFQVVGEYSKQYRAGEKKLTNKSLQRARRGGQFDADDAEEAAHEQISYGVVGWNAEDAGGNPVPFSRQNVALFLTAAPWVAPQILKGIKGHADFFKRASAS
jgi:hypothetical protein